MRKLILAMAALTGAMIATSASAQPYRGGGYYGGSYSREVRREQRECQRELRRAHSRRAYNRELRECRREIARAQREARRDRYGWRGDRYDRYRHSYGRRW